MKIGVSHSRYIANKIAIDLNNNSFVKLTKGLDIVVSEAEKLILADLKNENALEERVREVMEEYEDEIEYTFADEREMFKMIKKRLSAQYNFKLSYEERFNYLSHQILETLILNKLINFRVNKIKIKSNIFKSIENYIDDRFNLEDIVLAKIKRYKKKFIAGTDEYQLLFQKLYENELRAKGNI